MPEHMKTEKSVVLSERRMCAHRKKESECALCVVVVVLVFSLFSFYSRKLIVDP